MYTKLGKAYQAYSKNGHIVWWLKHDSCNWPSSGYTQQVTAIYSKICGWQTKLSQIGWCFAGRFVRVGPWKSRNLSRICTLSLKSKKQNLEIQSQEASRGVNGCSVASKAGLISVSWLPCQTKETMLGVIKNFILPACVIIPDSWKFVKTHL